jgi:endonuclease III
MATLESQKQRKGLSLAKKGELIFSRLSEQWPNAKCELEHNTPFQLLLAVVLSAQTTDKAVNKALTPLFKNQPEFGPADLISLGQLGFFEVIRTIGLAPTKSKNSFALSQQLIALHNGKVPHSREALEALPGVGRKTANVVLNELFGEPTLAIDTHLARLAVRMGLSKNPENRLKIEEDLLACIPQKHLQRAHHYMIFHGRYLCKARQPNCADCSIEQFCPKIGV